MIVVGECRHLHAQYMSLRDRLLSVCDDAADAVPVPGRVV